MTVVPFALLLVAAPQKAPLTPIVGTFRYDPVVLVKTGRPEVGALTIEQERHAYRYRFVSEENRREFLARPELYEIQLGGGCGSMGSLSGRGSPDRYTLHAGKIYVFASDGCRTRFLSAPEKYLEKDDPAPTGARDESEQGKTLLARTLLWAGGVKAWKSVRDFQAEIRETVKSGETTYDRRTTTTIGWPNRILRTDRWNDSVYAELFEGTNGYFIGATAATPMDPQQVRALQRIRNHMLPAILRAAADGKVLAFDRGPIAGGLRRVDTYFDRTWAALELNADSGEIRAMEFTGRRQAHGIERRVFRSFVEVGGLKLPSAWTAYFDGVETGGRTADQVFYRLDANGVSFDPPK